MAGIVHFSNYYRWMEQIEHEFFRSLSLKIVNNNAEGQTVGWPRVSASCRFQAPARYEDVIDAKLTVQRIGVKSLTFDVKFTRDGLPLASGTMKTVCCIVTDEHTLKSVEIPEVYASQLEEYVPPANE